MAEILNNVNLEKISNTIENGKNNKETLKKPVKLQGEWNFDTSKEYQFRTELPYENGKEVIEIDSPSFLGGGGKRLGPMAYCIAGITSCFIGTFVGIASSQGIKLTKLRVSTSCNVNFSKTFDISDDPITEGINFEIEVEGENSDNEKLGEILKLAHEKCPAMYSMSHIIPVNAQLK